MQLGLGSNLGIRKSLTAIAFLFPIPGGGGILSVENITDISADINFTKAINQTGLDTDLEYYLYSGDISFLSNVNLIELQTLESNGKDVATLPISLSPGEFKEYNVLVKDTAGNKDIYTPNSVLALDPEVLEFDVSLDGVLLDGEDDPAFEGDPEDQSSVTWDIVTQDGADDQVTVTSLDTNLVQVVSINQTVDGSGDATLEIQDGGQEDSTVVRVFPSFYGTFNNTPTDQRVEIQVLRTQWIEDESTQSAVYEFES